MVKTKAKPSQASLCVCVCEITKLFSARTQTGWCTDKTSDKIIQLIAFGRLKTDVTMGKRRGAEMPRLNIHSQVNFKLIEIEDVWLRGNHSIRR